jgi:hypothetical protein
VLHLATGGDPVRLTYSPEGMADRAVYRLTDVVVNDPRNRTLPTTMLNDADEPFQQ